MSEVPVKGPWPVGTFVWFWWDTGAMGASQCIGVVRRSGLKTATVEWPNGTRNRLAYATTYVKPCTGVLVEVAKDQWSRRTK